RPSQCSGLLHVYGMGPAERPGPHHVHCGGLRFPDQHHVSGNGLYRSALCKVCQRPDSGRTTGEKRPHLRSRAPGFAKKAGAGRADQLSDRPLRRAAELGRRFFGLATLAMPPSVGWRSWMNTRSEHVSSVRMAKIAQSYPFRTTLAFHVFFLTLLVVNVVRTLRHPMWRDEMASFQFATASASLWELLSKLQYTTHPGLWYSLVWLATRFTSDPTSMVIMHIVIAIAVWTVIFRWSPFETVEKCLLLLSYFLFWEYFVISRNYALVALIGFAFVALQQHRPQQSVIPWLLLGLLANTHVLGAIWSIALASTLVIKRGRLTPRFVTGAAIYLVLLAFSVKTAAPAPDFGPWATDVRFDTARFGQALLFPLGAFAPINPAWLAD